MIASKGAHPLLDVPLPDIFSREYNPVPEMLLFR